MNCGHPMLFAQDQVRWAQKVEPCLYCRIAALLADKEKDQAVLRDITARAEKLAAEVAAAKNVVETDIQMLDAARANNEQLAAEVRQWRICVYQDENKPFDERFAAETPARRAHS